MRKYFYTPTMYMNVWGGGQKVCAGTAGERGVVHASHVSSYHLAMVDITLFRGRNLLAGVSWVSAGGDLSHTLPHRLGWQSTLIPSCYCLSTLPALEIAADGLGQAGTCR